MEIIKLFLLATLGLLAGVGFLKQGLVRGDVSTKAGTLDVRLAGRRIVADFVNFRPGKIFYRLAVLPVGV